MKPFDLKKSLAGEPVKLRNGLAAYVIADLSSSKKLEVSTFLQADHLIGFAKDDPIHLLRWDLNGEDEVHIDKSYSIIGMWEEPRPRVQLDLPCPLKVPQEDMWLLRADDIIKTSYRTSSHSSWMIENGFSLDNGRCFATKEDAQEWLEGMCNARR